MNLIFTRKLKKCFLQFPHFTKLLLLGGYLEETVSLDAVLLALSSPLSLCSSKEDCWKEHRLGTELEKFHPNPSSRRRQWHPTPVLLPGKSHGWRSLVGCSPWGCKESDTLSDFTFTLHFRALEKEMATHSSILAWKIPWMEEPGWLLSMGSQRVGHD